MAGPLDGLLVIALEQAVAAPYCTSKLADAGARVIKIERPEGDFARGYDEAVMGQASYFVWLNGGKQSVVLNIKDPADKALMDEMIARADVFVQNLAPGAAARAGFRSEELRARHPRLITCDISGYGDEGPNATMKAYDLLIQAECGLAGITGAAEGPGRVGISVCDIATGLMAYSAILEALARRARTGEGGGIEVSLFSAMAEWMSVPLLQYIYGGRAPERVGLNHPSIAPYGSYPTRGEPILISIQNEREWRLFCTEVLERPDLADHPDYGDIPRRVANRPALDREISAGFLSMDRDVLVERLKRTGVAFGSLNSIEAASRHPHLRRTPVETARGTVELIARGTRHVGERHAPGPVPEIGSHSAEIRREFGAAAAAGRDAPVRSGARR